MAVAARPPHEEHTLSQVWLTASREQRPILRLLTAIWTLPEVTRVGLSHADTPGLDLWVFMERESEGVEAVISKAVRGYYNDTAHATFTLHVVPLADVPEDGLPPYETILER